MEHQDFFLTLAEISVAFAAFVTIILVVRQATGEQLSALQILVARSLIEMSLISLGLCILPIFIAILGLSEPFIWRISSGVAGCALLAIWGAWPSRRRRVTGQSDPPPRITYYTVLSISFMVAGLALINSAVWANVAIYAFVVTWQFAAIGWVFLWSLSVFLVPAERR